MAHDARFRFELHPELFGDGAGDASSQGQHLRAGGTAVIDEHERMLRRHAGCSFAMAAPTRALDEPRGRQFAG